MRRLLIRPGAIGDCILSLPVLEYLAEPYTEIWISSPLVPLIQFADAVRPLSSTGLDLVGVGDLEISPALLEKLRSFDLIVSWYGTNRPEFWQALANIAVACEFHAVLPPPGCTRHATDFFAEQTGAPPGLIPRINVRPAALRETILIHPFSGSKQKNWPLHRYRALAAQLPHPVEWVAGPEEELSQAMRFPDLAELADCIAGARLYIGNDSGITHLAAATGVPTLALFGPAAPQVWAPRGENATILYADPLDQLAVETVLAAANRLLESA